MMSAGGKARIICVGNRFKPGDDAGPRVYDYLAERDLPDGVELIDGGLAGINLLGLVESAQRVVFVDSLKGFAGPGEVVVLDGVAEAGGMDVSYGHSGGLGYLLKALPEVCEGDPPPVLVVGMEGDADGPGIASLARTCLELATKGRPAPTPT